jgi:hypothetical protein
MSGEDEITQQHKLAIFGLVTTLDLAHWLLAARNPAQVCRSLSQVVPEFTSGG